MTRQYLWRVRGYYADDVAPPKQPGALAIEVGGRTREALDLDVQALERRPDIGQIDGPFQVPL